MALIPLALSYNYYSFNIQKFNDNEPILINKWVQHINGKGPYVKFSYSMETFVHWLLPKNTNIIIKNNDYSDFGYPDNCKNKHDTCDTYTTEEFTRYSYIFPTNITHNIIIESMNQEIILYGANETIPPINYDTTSQCTKDGFKNYLSTIRKKKHARSHRIFSRGFGRRRRRLMELGSFKKINIHTGFLGTTYIEDQTESKDYFKVRENIPLIIDANDATESNSYAIITPNGDTKKILHGNEQFIIHPPITRGKWIINEVNTWFHVSYIFEVMPKNEHIKSIYLYNSYNRSLIKFDPAIKEYNISYRKLSNPLRINVAFEGDFALSINDTLYILTSNNEQSFNVLSNQDIHIGAEHTDYIIRFTSKKHFKNKKSFKSNHIQCKTESSECGDDQESRYNEITHIGGNSLDNRIIYTNGIPNHNYHYFADGNAQNPNEVCAFKQKIQLPKTPEKEDTFIPTNLGPVGVLRTGALLYNHLSNNNGDNDIAYFKHGEGPTLDTCIGHADPCNHYHYHALSKENTCAYCGEWKPCRLIGWMRDGFPIYSQCSKDNKFLTSCYHLKEVYTKTIFKIGNSGTLGFTFEGISGTDPDILLMGNQSYTFERTTASHPFRIVKESEINLISYSPYQRSLTVPETSLGLSDVVSGSPVTWTPSNTGVYYYICTVSSHTQMVGKIIVQPEKELGDDTTDYEFVKDKNNCELDEANGFNFTGKSYTDDKGETITGYAYVMSDDYPYVMTHYAGEPQNFTSTNEDIPINCPCITDDPLPKCGQNPDGTHFKYPCKDHQVPVNGICSDGCKARCTLCDTTDSNSLSFYTTDYEFPICGMNHDGSNKLNSCVVGKPDFRGICEDGCLQKCEACKVFEQHLCYEDQLPCQLTYEKPKCEGLDTITNYKDTCTDNKYSLCNETLCMPQCLERTCETCEHTYSYLEFKTKKETIETFQTSAIIKTNGLAIHPIEPYDTSTNGGWTDGNIDLSLLGYSDLTFVSNKNSCPLCNTFYLPDNIEKGNTLWKIPPNSDIGVSTMTGVYLYNTVNKDSEIDFYLEGAALDKCMGHPAENCVYHYSAYPSCIDIPNCGLFGYMYDGIPILANCSINGTDLTSCYEYSGSGLATTNYNYQNTANCHLDEANGYAFTLNEAKALDISYIKNFKNNQNNDPHRPFYAYIMNKNKPLYFPGFYGNIWGKKDRCPFKFANYTIEGECIETKPICVDFVKKSDGECSCTTNTEVCIQTTKEKGIEYYKNSNIPVLSSPIFKNVDGPNVIHSNSKIQFNITSSREINTDNSAILLYFSSTASIFTPMEYKSSSTISSTEYVYSWEKNIIDINEHAAHDIVDSLHIHSSSIVYDKLTNNGATEFGQINSLTYENKCKKPDETSGYDLSNCIFSNSNTAIKLSDCAISSCMSQANDGNEIEIECINNNGVFNFSGCLPRCSLPSDTTGYDTSNCDTTSHSIAENYCSISCATGYYSQSPSVKCVNNIFQLDGCSPSCTTISLDESYYDITTCQPQICDLLCKENHGGIPEPTICPSAGASWDIDTANGAVPCSEKCTIPNQHIGYNLTGITILETLTTILGNAIEKTTKYYLKDITCEDGFIGTPVVNCQATDNEVFEFTGCIKSCYMDQIDRQSYDVTQCDYENGILVDPAQCTLSCASGYDACTPDTTYGTNSEGNSKCTTSNSAGQITLNTLCEEPGDNITTDYPCKPICTLGLTQEEKTSVYNLNHCDSNQPPHWLSPLTEDNCHLRCADDFSNIKTVGNTMFDIKCAGPNDIFDLDGNKCSRLCKINYYNQGYDLSDCTAYNIAGYYYDVQENCNVTCLENYIASDGITIECDQTGQNEFMQISGCEPKNCTNAPDEISCDDGISCTVDHCLKAGETTSGNGNWDPDNPGCYHEYDNSVCEDSFTCTDTTCAPYAFESDTVTGCVIVKNDTACDTGISCLVDETCLPTDWDIVDCSGYNCYKNTNTGCLHMPKDYACSDLGNLCNEKVCRPFEANGVGVDGCITEDVVCDDIGECAVGVCDSAVGCVYTPNDGNCIDEYDCTVDTCGENKFCEHTKDDSLCEDSIGCTVDKCMANNQSISSGCEFVVSDTFCNDIINNAACSHGTCKPNLIGTELVDDNGCSWDNDNAYCNDDVSCTSDSCDPFNENSNEVGCVNDYICDATLGDECTLELERYNGKFLKPWSCALGRTFANCAYVQITIVERNLNQIQDAFDAEAEQQSELLTSSDPDNPCLPNPCVGDGSECIRVFLQEVCTENKTTETIECNNETVNTYKCNCINGLTGTNCLLESVKDSFDVPFEYTLYVVLCVLGICVCNSVVIGGVDILKYCEKAAEKVRKKINKAPAAAKYKRKQSDTNDIETPLVRKGNKYLNF